MSGVLAILDHVQVEAAQLPCAEAVYLLVHIQETVLLVGGFDAALKLCGAIHDPLIQRQHIAKRHLIPLGIKAVQVGKQEARGVADTTVHISSALEDFIRDGHFTGVVGRRYPQA